jgi:hypothetical protein
MEELLKLIERFGEMNERVKELKKLTDEDNKEIKKFMSTSGLDKVTSEHFVASYSVSKSESFDEEKLINRLKALGCSHVIKTVEVVDMELLESAIYDGQIAGSELADCKVVKEIPKLVVKVKKAGKKDDGN